MSLSEAELSARVLGVLPIGLPVPAPNRWTAHVVSASRRVCEPDILCLLDCYFRGYTSLTVNAYVSTPQGYIRYALSFPADRCWDRQDYAKFVKQVWGCRECSGVSGTFTYQIPLDTNGVIIPDDYLLIWAAANKSFTMEIITYFPNLPSLWAYTYFGFIYAWTQPAAVPFERKVEFPQTVEEPGTLACMDETPYVGYGPLFFDVNMPTLTNALLLDIGLESPFEQDVKLMILGPRGSYTRQYFSGTARVSRGYSDIYLVVESSLKEFTLVIWPQLYFHKLNRDYFAVNGTDEKVDVHEICRVNGRKGFPTYIRYIKALQPPPLPYETVDQLIEYIHWLLSTGHLKA